MYLRDLMGSDYSVIGETGGRLFPGINLTSGWKADSVGRAMKPNNAPPQVALHFHPPSDRERFPLFQSPGGVKGKLPTGVQDQRSWHELL
jgi:hypothetical protein